MLTITRIFVAPFADRNAWLPLEQWQTDHAFDFAIGTSHPSLAEAIQFLVPALKHLQDTEGVDLQYVVAGVKDSTRLWPRDYTPLYEEALHDPLLDSPERPGIDRCDALYETGLRKAHIINPFTPDEWRQIMTSPTYILEKYLEHKEPQ